MLILTEKDRSTIGCWMALIYELLFIPKGNIILESDVKSTVYPSSIALVCASWRYIIAARKYRVNRLAI